MPATYQILITGVDYRQVKPQHLHAVACMILDDNPHHHESRKDWAVAPITEDDNGDVATLRLRTLSDTVEQRMVGMRPGVRLVFGDQEGTVTSSPQLLAQTSWDTLASPDPTPPTSWTVTCVSPTSVSSHRRSSPLLTPSAVVGSLSRRWESLHGQSGNRTGFCLPRLTERDLTNVWVSHIDGHTVEESIPHRTHESHGKKLMNGFVGTITYRCDDANVAQVVDSYLRFAEYAGLGPLTTHGFGTIQVTAHKSDA